MRTVLITTLPNLFFLPINISNAGPQIHFDLFIMAILVLERSPRPEILPKHCLPTNLFLQIKRAFLSDKLSNLLVIYFLTLSCST